MADHRRNKNSWLALMLAPLLAWGVLLPAQQKGGGARKKGPQSEVFYTDVPAHAFDVILSRPAATSVTATVLAYENMEGSFEYGTKPGAYSKRTAAFQLKKGEPTQILIDSLQPDTQYFYRWRGTGPEWTFHTQRSRGASFSFAVQADSHLDENADPDAYKITLANVLAGKPDFFIDLGDTFMTDKRRSDFHKAFQQYVAQRYYFGLVCHSAPLFLVLGNHDGESGWRHDGTKDSMAAWSLGLRERYFPNPRPDGFYTGNESNDPLLGALENYYAWEWGGALFAVLDPYWPTKRQNGDDNWHWTLGEAQYRWLAKTLAGSKSPLKFVFIHHPVGGKEQPIRGGVDAARYNEWGGLNSDGSEGFKAHRPGWEMPIHQLLVKHGVAVVFHGHDHMFAKEEMEGIVYQLVPQPANTRAGNPRNAQEFGYTHGEVLGGSGYVRVNVTPAKAVVEYVRSGKPADAGFSYTVNAKRLAREPRPDNSPSAFLDNGDGTATGKTTGLMWQRIDGGEMTWEKAREYCAALSLANHHDWRLPATRELFTIMDQSRPKPAMDIRVFPPTGAEYWWTSETRADDPNRVWVVNAGGGAGPHPRGETLSSGGNKRYHARCVRGPAPSAGEFVDNGDGTITDKRTGLVWQKSEAPGELTWDQAQQYAKSLALGGHQDWRLPDIKELQSIHDVKAVRPSIDRKFFPGAAAEQYWSATPMSNRRGWVWTLDFDVGIVSYADAAEKLRVRAVRGNVDIPAASGMR